MDKRQVWDYALGIIGVTGLKTSPEFLAMAEKEKRGGDGLRRHQESSGCQLSPEKR
jgi:hypothetical protein